MLLNKKITDIVLYLLNNLNNYKYDDQIIILKKINSIYQIFFENDDYGNNCQILSKINKKISFLYLKTGDIKAYIRYLNYAIEFENNYNILSNNYKHTSILFKEKDTIF